MFPAQAPLPTDSSFPFQPDAGIQTSIRIAESLLGSSVAATRQIAGKFPKFGAPAGKVSCPAATGSAKVTLARGRASLARFSQGVAAARGNANTITSTRYFMSCHILERLQAG